MIALIDVKGTDNRTISNNASVNIRNMAILKNILNADFFYNANQLIQNKKQYDIIIFGFGSISSNIEQVKLFAKNQKPKKIFWLVGEYEQSMNPSLYYFCKETKTNFETIQNFYAPIKSNMCNKNNIIDINLLIWDSQNEYITKKYDCIYYSRWREGRKVYLKEYLHKPIYFSSDSKNFKYHKNIGCSPNYIKKLDWSNKSETLNLFKYSLYIEDVYTHKIYNHLANRFYESLKCNVIQFFDINCKNTINKSGIDFDDYFYVKNYTELKEKIQIMNKKDHKQEMMRQSIWINNSNRNKEKMIDNLRDLIRI